MNNKIEMNYEVQGILHGAGLEPTHHRVMVLSFIVNKRRPVTAQEILQGLITQTSINKVTLYRILDLLVEKKIVYRHSAGDRSFRYCFASVENKDGHCHFYCKECGQMQCISMHKLPLAINEAYKDLPVRIEDIEIRFDGVCQDCLQTS
ncbi:transcriptional repressor [Desulfohalobiaceae bacterium Ax17]|jgi:Fur family ferric uptake transcriptional regulator|uniref:Fur family transcriptional regulator n=1 Tax=Desulfovulcanus ferrireducens TaxID=2831190 RepID=UPI00207B9C01|nr:Fur family transcriptional regulator [Desulfovulcanus ferrireducens]MBT8764493.1 transcriptional repressor [Desulfovulcanus ferrireducens]